MRSFTIWFGYHKEGAVSLYAPALFVQSLAARLPVLRPVIVLLGSLFVVKGFVMCVRIIITAGGTTESIDAVRTLEVTDVDGSNEASLRRLSHFDISNISKGRFGLEIAKALRAQQPNAEITVIVKRELILESKSDPISESLRFIAFRSFKELQRAIDDEVSRGKVDIFLMAAAVSDYSPVAVEGKIASDQEEMVIRLKKNPKVLDSLRGRLGGEALLVGFKLLSNVSHERLIEVASRQLERSQCDFTIANDAARIDWERGWHPISVVSKTGEAWSFDGVRRDGAEALASYLLAELSDKRTSV